MANKNMEEYKMVEVEKPKGLSKEQRQELQRLKFQWAETYHELEDLQQNSHLLAS